MIVAERIEIIPNKNECYFIKDLNTNKYVELGKNEKNYLISLLDKTQKFESGIFTEEQKSYLKKKFEEFGFIGEIKKVKTKNTISSINICDFNPDELFDKNIKLINLLCSKYAWMLSFIAIIGSYFLIGRYSQEIISIDMPKIVSQYGIILFVTMLITTFLHEIAHGITCKNYGGSVHKIGIKLFYLLPVMYCDVNDIYRFNKRYKKIKVIMAGIVFQLTMAAIAIISYHILFLNNIKVEFLLIYALANIGMGILNLIPFVKLDGYWAVVHITDMTNLRDRSFKQILKLFGVKDNKDNSDKETVIQKMFLFSFGMLSAVFTPIFFAYNINTISGYFSSSIGVNSERFAMVAMLVLAVHYLNKFRKYISKIRR